MLLKFAIKDFKEDREFKNVSAKTLQNYMETLEQFHSFCVEQEIIDVADISTRNIKTYLIYCQQKLNNNPTTINTRLKIFFNYL